MWSWLICFVVWINCRKVFFLIFVWSCGGGLVLGNGIEEFSLSSLSSWSGEFSLRFMDWEMLRKDLGCKGFSIYYVKKWLFCQEGIREKQAGWKLDKLKAFVISSWFILFLFKYVCTRLINSSREDRAKSLLRSWCGDVLAPFPSSNWRAYHLCM